MTPSLGLVVEVTTDKRILSCVLRICSKIGNECLFCASIHFSSNTVYEMYRDRSTGKMGMLSTKIRMLL